MLKVSSNHKYLLEWISETENTIVGKLISSSVNNRYIRNIPEGYIIIFNKNHAEHKPFIFEYDNKKYFKIHEGALVCYDDLK